MSSIYIIRHGQASFGAANYDKLSDLGCRQATVLGEYLNSCGIHFDAVYSGDLQRQRKTAQLAIAPQAECLSHTIDPRFNEVRNEEQMEHLVPVVRKMDERVDALLEEGMASSKNYQKVLQSVFNYWVSPQCDEPAIQSWADYSTGVYDAVKEVMQAQGSGKTVGIFTSGGTIATIVSKVLGLEHHQIYNFYEPVINCSITQLFYSRDRVSLSFFNDHSYLKVLGEKYGEELVSYR